MMIAKGCKKKSTKKLDGKDGVCDIQRKQQQDIDELKKWRIYQAVMMIVLIILISGRYIFGPTQHPAGTLTALLGHLAEVRKPWNQIVG